MRAKWKKKRMRRLKRKRRKMRQRSKFGLLLDDITSALVDWNELHCVLRMLKASIPTECDLNTYDTSNLLSVKTYSETVCGLKCLKLTCTVATITFKSDEDLVSVTFVEYFNCTKIWDHLNVHESGSPPVPRTRTFCISPLICEICIFASSLFRLSRRSLGMKGGLVILKLMRGMLGIFPPLPTWYDLLDQDVGEDEDALPVDVKEGQFAVHTVDDGRLRRSVVELIYLTNPEFLKLLEQAEQEFGFGQMGILVIPCTYGHLQSVIGRK